MSSSKVECLFWLNSTFFTFIVSPTDVYPFGRAQYLQDLSVFIFLFLRLASFSTYKFHFPQGWWINWYFVNLLKASFNGLYSYQLIECNLLRMHRCATTAVDFAQRTRIRNLIQKYRARFELDFAIFMTPRCWKCESLIFENSRSHFRSQQSLITAFNGQKS